jgi:hypothetical protein
MAVPTVLPGVLDNPRSSRPFRFHFGPALVWGSILVGAVLLVVPWQRAREEARSSACAGRLYQIGALLRAYFAVHGTYPAAPDEPATLAPAISWRLLILLPTDSGLDGYNRGETWNSAHNRQFIPAPYGNPFWCPSDFADQGAGRTSYLAVIGNGTVWSAVRSGHIRHPEMEAAEKIVLIEVPRSAVFWTEPRDITVDEALALFRQESGFVKGRHSGGLHYLTADGAVHSFQEVGDGEEFAMLLRVAG